MENRGKSSTGPDQMQQYINNKCSVDYDTLSTYKDEGWDLNYFRDCVESIKPRIPPVPKLITFSVR